MTAKDLEALFNYAYWANNKLLGAVSQLTTEQFVQPVAGSYGSVRNTLVHAMSAEWGWLDRCGGHPRGPALKAEDYPTVASLVERWREIEGYMRDFLSRLRDDDLDRVVEFAFGGGPTYRMRVGHLLQHAVIHGVHHRGQVSLLLRSLGVAPGNFDYLFYE